MAGNYPFFHPRFAGQMLKPPHPVAVAGYLAAMLVNPNNHALDGGPPPARWRRRRWRDSRRCSGSPRRSRPPHRRAARSRTSRRCGSPGSSTPARPWSSAPTPTTRTPACAGAGIPAGQVPADAARADRPRRAGAAAARRRRRHRRADRRARPGSAPSTRSTRRSRCASARRADPRRRRLRRLLPAAGRRAGGLDPAPGPRSPGPTRWWWTRTSTGCSRSGAARCSSATRRSAGTTGTTRPTRTSRPRSCTWARSASSAPGGSRRRGAVADPELFRSPRRPRAGPGGRAAAARAWPRARGAPTSWSCTAAGAGHRHLLPGRRRARARGRRAPAPRSCAQAWPPRTTRCSSARSSRRTPTGSPGRTPRWCWTRPAPGAAQRPDEARARGGGPLAD